VLAAPGVAPHHARIVHQGGGQLVFADNGQGPSVAGGRPIGPGQTVPFDLVTPFSVGQTQVPPAHPAIALMLMARGQHQSPSQLVIGSDPATSSLVIQHPAVAKQHAVLACDKMTITDLGAPSGVSLGNARIAPQSPVPQNSTAIHVRARRCCAARCVRRPGQLRRVCTCLGDRSARIRR